jgi:hypothetical protein
MDVREKLVELLNGVQETGVNEIPAGFGCTREYVKNEKVASHLIANGVTVQEWISVKDRLPDWRDGKVLVFTKYGFSICERTVNNRWQGQHANWITHWAYLPQPPKGE